MASPRRLFHLNIAQAALLFVAILGAMWQDELWTLGVLVPCAVLQCWQLYKLGHAAQEA